MKDQRSKVEAISSVIQRPAFLAGLLLGSVAGAAMMVLARRGWEKLRAKIQKQGTKLRNQATDSMNEMVIEGGDKAHQFTASVDRGISDLQQNAQDMIGDGRK
jgi:gas vesicle protein